MIDNIRTAIAKTDWALLAQQKLALLTACETQPELEGIVNWIDAIQDAAEHDGYPVVFLYEDEED